MRFGIIGAGRIGKIHAANVAVRKDCEVRQSSQTPIAAAAAIARRGDRQSKVAEIDAILRLERNPTRWRSARQPTCTPT